MLFAAGVVGILVATVVRFFAYRFLVFNEELDQEPEFSHDHELIERHHHEKAGAHAPSPERSTTIRRLPCPPGTSSSAGGSATSVDAFRGEELVRQLHVRCGPAPLIRRSSTRPVVRQGRFQSVRRADQQPHTVIVAGRRSLSAGLRGGASLAAACRMAQPGCCGSGSRVGHEDVTVGTHFGRVVDHAGGQVAGPSHGQGRQRRRRRRRRSPPSRFRAGP